VARADASRTFRRQRGVLGAHELHSQYDSRDLTRAARAKSPSSTDYWEHKVDPDGGLDPEERARRAGHAKKAYFTRLAMKSAAARRRAS
jgi:hypothetical protein